MKSRTWTIVFVAAFGAPAASAPSAAPEPGAYAELLRRYVDAAGNVDYDAWSADAGDVARLTEVVDAMEAGGPGARAPREALAYWIDLYNAATLELVLGAYPVDSIRDIPGPEGSPWRRRVVHVEGDSLSLDDIEHDVIRARFHDARVHFALNCASRGCPPLARVPYSGDDVNARLDAVTRAALGDDRWVRVTGETVEISRLFQWFEEDFVDGAGSVAAFISRYRATDDVSAVSAFTFRDYDWSLNRADPPRDPAGRADPR